MFADRTAPRDRLKSLIAVVAIHGALGYALIAGLAVDLPRQVADSLQTFTVLPVPKPTPTPVPKPKPRTERAPRKEGAASPANLTAKATEVVAPPPVIPPPEPPPVVAAPKAATGAADHSGNAPVPGPGTGSGGIGEGTGNGRYGDGPGGGGGGRPLQRIAGEIRDSDYPRGAPEDDRVRRVGLRFVVGVKGRVTDCTVTRSSGNRLLDDATCALLIKRLRYRPELDSRGRPVPVTVDGEHEWYPIERGYDDY